MIRPLECFVGLRYLSTGRGRGLVSFMSFASLAGIALGVAAVIVVLSVMNGLESETRNRLLSMTEHISVRPMDGALPDAVALAQSIRAAEGVSSAEPYVKFEAILESGGRLRAVMVRGIDPAAESDSGMAAVVGGEGLDLLEPGSNRVLLGRFVADELGAFPGDAISVFLPGQDAGLAGFRNRGLAVAGEFAAGYEGHDASLALMNIVDASRLAGFGGDPQGVAVQLERPLDVGLVEAGLRERLGENYRWSNWATENRRLFQAMAIEKTMMTVLLLLIVAVAAFNIVTSLTMVVNEKAKDIAILRTLGLGPERVTRIFLFQGAVLGVGGTVLGVILGLLLAENVGTILPWLEQTFGFTLMPGDVFYISSVPSEVRARDMVLIPVIALAISTLATVLPSRKAARIEPAEVLRYE